MSAPNLVPPGTTGGGAPVGGSGTIGTVPKWATTTTLNDSVITQSGSNVGIGTTSPSGKLVVASTTVNGSFVHIDGSLFNGSSNNSNNVGLKFLAQNSAQASTEYGSIQMLNQVSTAGSEKGRLRFFVADSGPLNEVMSILGGNVGIGTTGPTGRLHVVGGTAAAATNGAPVTIIAQNAGTGNQNGGNIVLTPGALSGSGSAGVADLSGPTGTGIKLPATPGNADTQTLDCYAEGTWTVTDTSGAGLIITPNYTPIVTRWGRLVTFICDITYPATADTSVAQIALPIALITSGYRGHGSAYSSVGPLISLFLNADALFYISAARVTNATLSGARIIFSATYAIT